MIPESKSKFSGWMAVSLFLSIPIILLSINTWLYGISEIPFLREFSLTEQTIICTFFGMIAWLFYVIDNFRKHIIPRLIAGAIAGATTFWTFGGYVYFRGGEYFFKFEIILAFLPGIATGMFVYYLLTKDKTMFNNFNGVSD